MEPTKYDEYEQTLNSPTVLAFFEHQNTAFTCTYLVIDKLQKVCAVIDPAYNFHFSTGVIETHSIDKVIKFIEEHDLRNIYILETHVHADHLTAADYVKSKVGGECCIGENVTKVQAYFAGFFKLENFPIDGSQFDRLLSEKDELEFGSFKIKILHTPGHTPACLTYIIGDCAFCGDTIFMPDMGSARCDFPGGSAEQLYHSFQKMLTLPPDLKIFVGHDYAPNGRSHQWETTIQAQLLSNKHLKQGTTLEEFVKMRQERDQELALPNLLYPSIQVNMRGGKMPEDGFFKIPVSIKSWGTRWVILVLILIIKQIRR